MRDWRSPRVAAGTAAWIRRQAVSDWEPPLDIKLLGKSLCFALAPPPHREDWLAYVERLLGEFRQLAAGPFIEFDSPPRRDQAIALRRWGIAFRGQAALDESAFHYWLGELAQRAREGARVQGLRPAWRNLPLPGLIADDLESLLGDVLNEEEPVAHRASLVEDFLERTDLRIRYSELKRRRGARVQVSWSATPEAQFEKTGSFVRHDEYVFLSPWQLARNSTQWKDPTQWFAAFKKALRASHESPLGPMAAIPPRMRQEIRAWVHSEAIRTTERLREREAELGQLHVRRKRPKLTGGRDESS